MAIKAPYLPYEKLRQISDEFLAGHHPAGDLPIPIEKIIEFDFGLDIVPIPGLKSEFDIEAYVSSDLTEIRVDQFIQRSRENRYRFSLAHELSHVLIHQDVFKQMAFKTVAEWKAAMQAIDADQYGWIEWQAYSLAGLLLVPGKPLKDVLEEKSQEAMSAGIDLRQAGERARQIVTSNIARYFGVSADVINKRIDLDRLWP